MTEMCNMSNLDTLPTLSEKIDLRYSLEYRDHLVRTPDGFVMR